MLVKIKVSIWHIQSGCFVMQLSYLRVKFNTNVRIFIQ